MTSMRLARELDLRRQLPRFPGRLRAGAGPGQRQDLHRQSTAALCGGGIDPRRQDRRRRQPARGRCERWAATRKSWTWAARRCSRPDRQPRARGIGRCRLAVGRRQDDITDIAALEAFVAQAKSSGRGMSGDVLVVTGIPWRSGRRMRRSTHASTPGPMPTSRCTWAAWMGIPAGRIWRCASAPAWNKRSSASFPRKSASTTVWRATSRANGFGVDEGLEIDPEADSGADAAKNLAGATRGRGVPARPPASRPGWIRWSMHRCSMRIAGSPLPANCTAHVAALPVVKPDDPSSFKAALALRAKYGDIPNLTIPGVKVFADGVVEYPSQSAA